MIHYSLCFIFDDDRNVLLIKKNRPSHLKGKWNGVGGKIEEGESAISGAIREIREESGLIIPNSQLHPVGQMIAETYKISVYTSIISSLQDARSLTDEEIEVFSYDKLFVDSNGLELDPHAFAFLQLSAIKMLYNQPINAVVYL